MFSPCRIALIFIAAAFHLVATVSSYKILLLMPIATKSETHLLNPIAKALLDRGHQVTLVTPASSFIKHDNFTEIVPVKYLDMEDFFGESADPMTFRKSRNDALAVLFLKMPYISERCHSTYRHKDFSPVLQAKSYDLVLTSVFFSECFLGLIYKLGAPFIQLSSMPLPKHALDVTGMRTPLAFCPNPLIELTDKMSLSERLINVFSSWSFTLLNYHHYFHIGESIYKQYLGQDLPNVNSIRNNVSLVFSNTHFSTNYPRPLMPDVIEIGGVHCQPAKPLPKEFEEFVSANKEGFILFSLGTVYREEFMPENIRQIFINVFSRLKINVLWKYKSDIPNLPKNVKISQWLPQQDVLGHPNIKLCISHGGLLSTQEAVYHGVPVLGIPLFTDQDVNMKQVESYGAGIKLEILELTEELLESTLRRMLDESSFQVNAKKTSALFRDQPQTPLDRAIYFMEYTVRHKGIPQIRSSARNLSYMEYHMYDIQLIFLAILSSVVIVIWKLISKVLSLFWEAETSKITSLSKKTK